MSLTEKYNDNFTPEARLEGQRIFADGRCSVLTSSQDRLEAEVSQPPLLHDTSWHVIDRRLIPGCDCDCFTQNRQLCPHLWAALIAAENSGELSGALKRNVPQRILLVSNDNAHASSKNQTQAKPNKAPQQGQTVQQPAPPPQDVSYQPLDTRKRRPRPTSTNTNVPCSDYTYDRQDAQTAAPASRFSQPRMSEPQQIDVLFIINLEKQQPDTLFLDLAWRPFPHPNATQNTPPPNAKTLHVDPTLPPPSHVVAQLLAWNPTMPDTSTIQLDIKHAKDFLDLLDAHNLLRWRSSRETPPRLHQLAVTTNPGNAFVPDFSQLSPTAFSLRGMIQLPDKTIDLHDALFLWTNGLLLTRNLLICANLRGQFPLASSLVAKPPRILAIKQAQDVARTFVLDAKLPVESFPEPLRPDILAPKPQGRLYVKTALYKYQGREQLHAELSFNYQGTIVTYPDNATDVPDERTHHIIKRDFPEEHALALKLQLLGFRWNDDKKTEEIGWKLPPAMLDDAVRTLVNDDWLVTAQGKSFRKPTTKTAVINARVDWFELEGNVTFDAFTVPLPALIQAKNKGLNAVRLDDGTFGILPLEWLEHFTALTELGECASDKIKFKMQQATIVESLVQDAEVAFDEHFSNHVRQLDTLRPTPAQPSPDFKATLRPYQQDGLGWLLAMNRRGLGACLADDMGLGKTIQILSLLDCRRQANCNRPSLVVMPKSLIFNWQAEVSRFAPHLKTLDYTGSSRQRLFSLIPTANIVFTTYGTLRNDITQLAQIHFDYCILDESQAIKNADSSTAIACRAIHADYRVAMTGTPIENKLAELFSQLDFINPGLMGKLLKDDSINTTKLPPETFRKVRQAVKCFILRRTKEMVAKNLPPKTEQVLFCELDEQHQREYDALKDHFRKQLDDATPTGSSMDALTALLKLRQCACHPALVFQNRNHDVSAKVDTLLEHIQQLVSQNHKVLVFSQFTSLLKIVSDTLCEQNLQFAYLDGQTQNRSDVVNQFQNDANTHVFLISLKAGGVGLNLTAADYVFILDPWWNPAAEAQAIDRAYRIGQTKPVFAYKLITKNTIEEKVLQLQERKRHLANTFLKDTPTPTSLTKDDIRFLLS